MTWRSVVFAGCALLAAGLADYVRNSNGKGAGNRSTRTELHDLEGDVEDLFCHVIYDGDKEVYRGYTFNRQTWMYMNKNLREARENREKLSVWCAETHLALLGFSDYNHPMKHWD